MLLLLLLYCLKFPTPHLPCVYFQSQLFRGNRTHKYNTENFDAFKSANLPSLADVGIHITYNNELLLPAPTGSFSVHHNFDNNVAILKIFPGISEKVVHAILSTTDLKAVVFETYGSGNAMRESWFISALENAIKSGIIILNISQCNKGFVDQGRYETSSSLQQIGVLSGEDMSTEAAIAKLMFLLGGGKPGVAEGLRSSLRGELTSELATSN